MKEQMLKIARIAEALDNSGDFERAEKLTQVMANVAGVGRARTAQMAPQQNGGGVGRGESAFSPSVFEGQFGNLADQMAKRGETDSEQIDLTGPVLDSLDEDARSAMQALFAGDKNAEKFLQQHIRDLVNEEINAIGYSGDIEATDVSILTSPDLVIYVGFDIPVDQLSDRMSREVGQLREDPRGGESFGNRFAQKWQPGSTMQDYSMDMTQMNQINALAAEEVKRGQAMLTSQLPSLDFTQAKKAYDTWLSRVDPILINMRGHLNEVPSPANANIQNLNAMKDKLMKAIQAKSQQQQSSAMGDANVATPTSMGKAKPGLQGQMNTPPAI